MVDIDFNVNDICSIVRFVTIKDANQDLTQAKPGTDGAVYC